MDASNRRVDEDARAVAARLLGETHRVEDAIRKPFEGGLPECKGLYAWWMTPGAIRDLRGPPHPTEELELLYVGVAPKDAASGATLRSRVRRQHIGGNIGSSTFRQSLAALLFEEQGWCTESSGSRARLRARDNRLLSEWQQSHLRLAWADHPRPWSVERCVIRFMEPPLNLAGNTSHPMYRQLKERRAKLRASSG